MKRSPIWAWDVMCCGSVNIREVPGQFLFSDEHGAWVRRSVA